MMWAHTCTQNHPVPLQVIFQQVSPVSYTQCSAPVLYAPNLQGAGLDLMVPVGPFQPEIFYNMPVYALRCLFPIAFYTNEREKHHLLNTSKKRRQSHSSEGRAFTFPARCTLVGHWRNALRSYDFKQLVHDKTPNKDPSGGRFLCLINIVLSK